MIDWQAYLPLIESALHNIYPQMDGDSATAQGHQLAQQARQQQIIALFSSLNQENEIEQTELFVNDCITNDISYTLIYGDLMTLGRTLLGALANGQNCLLMVELNQSFDRIEKKVSQAYLQNYLRKLSVKNHIRLTHLANLSEKNLLVHYQNHLQWMIRLINKLQGAELPENIELDHNLCAFGKWLHGKAIPSIKSTSYFKEVERLHIQLHQLGRDVLTHHQQDSINCKSMIHLMSRLDYISLEIGAEIAILNDMLMITEYHKDPLTGVLTRHLLDKIMSAQIEIAKATESTCVLMMLDLDHFKTINDTYGHLTGDKVIQNFTTILKRILRKSDFIFRFGGEEFLVLVPSTNAVEAQNITQKILNEVRSQEIITNDEQLIRYTVSIGITTIEPSNLSFVTKEVVNHYIGEADSRLYLAKRNGRNRAE
jgi:diguanylate cyclase (GGDEF)-like protein